MTYFALICPWLPANAMALYPFMLFKNRSLKENKGIIYHEKIHFYQQLELLIIPFYVLYILNYLINLLRYKNHHQSYLNICFEKEAYSNDHDYSYLNHRRLYSWLRFL